MGEQVALVGGGEKLKSVTAGAGKEIPGLDQGVVGMCKGGRRIMVVPTHLAYGASSSAKIPANSDLVLEVTLVKVKSVVILFALEGNNHNRLRLLFL
jgi:FKBP-type peptidyl-prolyl cis-trans isomerase 2